MSKKLRIELASVLSASEISLGTIGAYLEFWDFKKNRWQTWEYDGEKFIKRKEVIALVSRKLTKKVV